MKVVNSTAKTNIKKLGKDVCVSMFVVDAVNMMFNDLLTITTLFFHQAIRWCLWNYSALFSCSKITYTTLLIFLRIQYLF